jgi:hypothetical protein
MPVDMHIGTIETKLSAADPDALRTPAFMAEIVRMVKEELAREKELEARRDADRAPGRRPARIR